MGMPSRFDFIEEPYFIPRKKETKCLICQTVFKPRYRTSKTCSDTCANLRYIQRTAKPSKYKGSYLNLTEFNKAWEEAKKQDTWHAENVAINLQLLQNSV